MDKYTRPIWSESALLTIDMQKDFSQPHAPAYIDGTEKVVPKLQRLVQHYRSRDLPIIHMIRLYLKDGTNVDLCRRKSVENGNFVVPVGSVGADLVPELHPEEKQTMLMDINVLFRRKPQPLSRREWLLYKPRWGAFYQTGLEHLLQDLQVSTLVVAGCNFPNCPRTTIYEASERDYRTVLVRDAVSGLYSRGEKELNNIGVGLYSVEAIMHKA